MKECNILVYVSFTTIKSELSSINFAYKLHLDLPKDVRPRILLNYEISEKSRI